MRNSVKLRGKFLPQLPFEDRDKFTVRIHCDASFNNQASLGLGSRKNIIGFGYCVELAPYAPKSAIPAYGYGAVTKDVNNCSATAELIGIVGALKETGLRDNIEIICDNRDAVNIANHIFKGEKASRFQTNYVLRGVLEELQEFAGQGITARWVRGHNGDMYNHAVNMLARLARKTVEDGNEMWYAIRKETNMLNSFRQMSEAL